jgi:hypothetical protein
VGAGVVARVRIPPGGIRRNPLQARRFHAQSQSSEPRSQGRTGIDRDALWRDAVAAAQLSVWGRKRDGKNEAEVDLPHPGRCCGGGRFCDLCDERLGRLRQGAIYQIELSVNTPGRDGGGVWLWIALYPDFTGDTRALTAGMAALVPPPTRVT